MKIYNLNLSTLTLDTKLGLKDYSSLFNNGIKLKEFLKHKNYKTDIKSGRTPSRFREDYWGGEHEFLTMQDVDTVTYTLRDNCTDLITDTAIDENKTLYQAPEDALIISNAMTVGLSFITNRSVYLNQNVFHLNVDEKIINKKFLMWYFNAVLREIFNQTFSSKYLSKEEVSRITIPVTNKKAQDRIVELIKPIEQDLIKLQSFLVDENEIINRVFCSKFQINLEKLNELKKIKVNSLTLRDFSNNIDMRNSYKFHSLASNYACEALNSLTTKKIKDYLGLAEQK